MKTQPKSLWSPKQNRWTLNDWLLSSTMIVLTQKCTSPRPQCTELSTRRSNQVCSIPSSNETYLENRANGLEHCTTHLLHIHTSRMCAQHKAPHINLTQNIPKGLVSSKDLERFLSSQISLLLPTRTFMTTLSNDQGLLVTFNPLSILLFKKLQTGFRPALQQLEICSYIQLE